ncbi:PREDICTED: mitochondrial intermembrane space import and assembly protein 40-B [Vollenhovia emeryi]|uniref:mitochondrial intermembrane space import and assembly protein 40-B n=1 Tax=Vollenhovia emeryi TaxID=411798 RepID=UPI0005F5300D|nr:PREDICTED: mitochondrial intermembrane space import and assembly protein 40-B [Vollenhovia emeryi]
MPLIRKVGKDTIIFASKEDHAVPSKISLPEPEPSPGLLLPNGEINWNCPCLGGMATGPCGVEFREAFSCFHYSTADPKGSDCRTAFETMQSCMSQYPALYENKGISADDLEDDEIGEDEEEEKKQQPPTGSEGNSKAMVVSQSATD